VLIESPDALPLSVPVQTIERACDRIEDVGLQLEEAKAILMGLQEQPVRQQLAEYLQVTDAVRVAIGHGISRVTIRCAFDPRLAIWRSAAHAGCGAPARIRRPRRATAH
jgi:hypothetical protein